MKNNFCEKCGKNLNGKDKFCSGCGEKSNDNFKSNNSMRYRNIVGGIIIFMGVCSFFNADSVRDFITGMLFALFGVSLLPCIYEKLLCKYKIQKLYIILPVLLFLSFIIVIPKDSIDDNNRNQNKVLEKEPNSNNKDNYSNLKTITDDKLQKNFIDACASINMDINKVRDLKKVDDWNSGPRYTFKYNGTTFILYAYDNGNVSSITINNNNLDKIYLEGYESYNVNDYLIESGLIVDLQLKAETSVKSVLNHPDTADFHWITTGAFSRNNNIYIVTGKFEAENSFGVKSESTFYIEEVIENGNCSVVYMTIDSKKYIGTKSQIQNIARKEIIVSGETNVDDNSITIKDGQKGEYGKDDLFDGEKYIRYYLPAGKYEVEALTKNAQFFIETIALHKEDGWDTATTIRKVTLLKLGDKDNIEITSSQCISLVMYTQIKLTPIN